MLVDVKFQDVKVLMRTNVDYSGPLLAHGKKVYEELVKQEWVINSIPAKDARGADDDQSYDI